MSDNETNTISIELTELLQKRLNFISIIQQIFGVLFAIGGAISCLGIITAIMGIPALIAGIRLFQSGSALALTVNSKKGKDLIDFFNCLNSYWKFTVIGFIIVIIFYALLFFSVITLISSFPSFPSYK